VADEEVEEEDEEEDEEEENEEQGRTMRIHVCLKTMRRRKTSKRICCKKTRKGPSIKYVTLEGEGSEKV